MRNLRLISKMYDPLGFQDFLINFEHLHEEIRKECPYTTFRNGYVNGHTQNYLPSGDTNKESTKLSDRSTKPGHKQFRVSFIRSHSKTPQNKL